MTERKYFNNAIPVENKFDEKKRKLFRCKLQCD